MSTDLDKFFANFQYFLHPNADTERLRRILVYSSPEAFVPLASKICGANYTGSLYFV